MRWSREFAAAVVCVLALGSCLGPDPAGFRPQPLATALLVRADLSGTTAATVVVDVTAPDIPTVLVFNLPVVDRVAAGTITVPAGSDRRFTLRAYDVGGVETHSGAATVDVHPGGNPTISIVLMPLTGGAPIYATLGSYVVTVAPALDTLALGDTVTLTATVLDANGSPVAGQVAWGSVAPAVATVVSTGAQRARVTAIRPGRAAMAATYGGTAGVATIAVAGWYVSPSGSSGGDGSGKPWDLQTALSGGNGKVQPGDTIWLRGGSYAGSYLSTLTGTPAAPIVVRQYRGERATLDGASSTRETLIVDGGWTAFWGFEITNSGSNRFCSSCLGLRPAGVYIRNTSNVKLIHLIVHDVGHGVFTENAAQNIEINGLIIYNGGNTNSTRSDGHGIYVENSGLGTKVARDNVIFNMFGFGIHAYTGTVTHALKNLTFDGNAIFNSGVPSGFDTEENLLLGSPFALADNDLVQNNMVYYSPSVTGHLNVQIGQDTVLNGTLTLGDNYLAAGGNDALTVGHWQNLTVTNGTTVGTAGMVNIRDTTTAGWRWEGNQYWRDPQVTAWAFNGTSYTLDGWKAATSLGTTDHGTAGQPMQPQVFVRPSPYEPGRAYVIVYNWPRQRSVLVDLSAVLRVGDRFAVHNVQDLWGTLVASGTYGGARVSIPMTGVTPPAPIGGSPAAPIQTGPDFDVFLVTRTPP